MILTDAVLSERTLIFLHKCALFTTDDLLKHDEDSFMRLSVSTKYNKLVLSRKCMQEVKILLHKVAPERFNEDFVLLPAPKDTKKDN